MLGQGTYIKVKASLAQFLIERSWAQSQQSGNRVKPWPWADTAVSARLSVQDLEVEQFVMQDASGESLAFGPGLIYISDQSDFEQVMAIAGHRDTHFKFLQQIEKDTVIEMENMHGEIQQFRVVETRIYDSDISRLEVSRDSSKLVLITCWPFDAVVPGGSMRYAVVADLI